MARHRGKQAHHDNAVQRTREEGMTNFHPISDEELPKSSKVKNKLLKDDLISRKVDWEVAKEQAKWMRENLSETLAALGERYTDQALADVLEWSRSYIQKLRKEAE